MIISVHVTWKIMKLICWRKLERYGATKNGSLGYCEYKLMREAGQSSEDHRASRKRSQLMSSWQSNAWGSCFWMKLNGQWRLWNVRGPKNRRHELMKDTGSIWRLPRREAIWFTTSNAMTPKYFKSQISASCILVVRPQGKALNIWSIGFHASSGLILSHPDTSLSKQNVNLRALTHSIFNLIFILWCFTCFECHMEFSLHFWQQWIWWVFWRDYRISRHTQHSCTMWDTITNRFLSFSFWDSVSFKEICFEC